MPKLFIALELSAGTTERLVGLQPPPSAGLRLPAAAQMHLTLHFLGEAELDRADAVLRPAPSPRFSLTLEGVGQFPSAGGSVTLWAGVRKNPELLVLHGAIGAALVREGFRPESRPYAPHITLARWEPGVPPAVIAEWIASHAAFSLTDVPVTEVALYSSTFVGDAPVYRRERVVELAGTP